MREIPILKIHNRIKYLAANPKIIISDEAMQPLTEHRGSTSSSATFQTTVPTISNSVTYGAKLNRFVDCFVSKFYAFKKNIKGVLEVEQLE